MTKLGDDLQNGTYSFNKLEKWIKRQLNTFNTQRTKAKVKKLASLAELDTLLIPVN